LEDAKFEFVFDGVVDRDDVEETLFVLAATDII
jgi:hypothetical protein